MAIKLTGIDPAVASKSINLYRNSQKSFGVSHKAEVLMNYFSNIWPEVIKQQPEAPEGYEWEVGFYNAIINDHLSVIIAPILIHSIEKNILDAIINAEYFNINVADAENRPVFFMNEGNKWP